MDVLDFVDSPDLRAFFKNRSFPPAEQAVLCLKSNHRSCDEKVKFLASLLETYPESSFPLEDFDDTWNIREELQDIIAAWELSNFEKDNVTPGDVFVTHMRFLDSDDEFLSAIFSTYCKAYDDLRQEKEESETEGAVYMSIEKRRIDDPKKRITYVMTAK